MKPAKQLNLGVLLYGCGHHQAAWMMPESSIELIGNVTYYQELARIAESGFLDAVFFADNQSFPATTSTEIPAFWFDPMINLITATNFYQVCHLIYHLVPFALPRFVTLFTKTTTKPYRPRVISLQGFLLCRRY